MWRSPRPYRRGRLHRRSLPGDPLVVHQLSKGGIRDEIADRLLARMPQPELFSRSRPAGSYCGLLRGRGCRIPPQHRRAGVTVTARPAWAFPPDALHEFRFREFPILQAAVEISPALGIEQPSNFRCPTIPSSNRPIYPQLRVRAPAVFPAPVEVSGRSND